MAPKLSVPVTGALVAAVASPWEFPDEVTGEIRKGVTRILFISQSFDSEPVAVRLGNDTEGAAWFVEAEAAGLGAAINVTAQLRQYSGRDAFLTVTKLHAVGKPGRAA